MTINPYLAKLRTLEAKRPPPADVAGFVSFVSAQGSPIAEPAIPQGRRAPANLERRHLRQPTKLTKPTMTPPEGGFVSFVSAQSRPISKFEISKSASSEKRQNRQNSPQFPEALHHVLNVLDGSCPDYIDHDRWRHAVEDGRHFLSTWGEHAQALGWTARDPHPSYRRLSRYDQTGLIWLLQGSEVLAITADTATIRRPSGSTTTYRKSNTPTPSALGDGLDGLQ
jgi:hypothetical protein